MARVKKYGCPGPKAIGYKGEGLAAEFLQSKGYEILMENFTVHGGEIDLVAYHKSVLIFIEVKTRTKDGFGTGEESMTALKRKRLQYAIQSFLMRGNYSDDTDYRADLIEIEIKEKPSALPNITHFEDIEL